MAEYGRTVRRAVTTPTDELPGPTMHSPGIISYAGLICPGIMLSIHVSSRQLNNPFPMSRPLGQPRIVTRCLGGLLGRNQAVEELVGLDSGDPRGRGRLRALQGRVVNVADGVDGGVNSHRQALII